MYKNSRRQQTGSAALLLATMVGTLLIPLTGLAVDGTIMWIIKLKVQSAMDSAALAGARSLSVGLDLASQQASAQATAIKYFNANFPAGYWNTSNIQVTAVAAQTALRTRTVTVTGSVDSPLYFMQILGHKIQTIAAGAVSSRRDVDLEIVLDRSSSMGGAMTPMLAAARTFASQFAEGRDSLGLVVFGGQAVLGFPATATTGPMSNFKSATPSLDSQIAATAGCCNTGTAQALNMAYNQLVTKNDPGALNLIVLFTDGLPNGIWANYNDTVLSNNYIKTSGSCTNRGRSADPMNGFIAQWSGFAMTGTVVGVMNLGSGTISVGSTNETQIPAHISDGCNYQSNSANIHSDLTQLPPTDLFGNSLTTGYAGSVSLTTALTSPYWIGKASLNAADNQVLTMRQNAALQPVIYTIGYFGGTEAPDQTWLARIANDPSSTSFDSTYPAGMFVYVPSQSQLMAAFNKVASEILRLAK